MGTGDRGDYRTTRLKIVAHRDVLKQWPTLSADLDAYVDSELDKWARANDLVLSERREGKEREITADPRWLVDRPTHDAERVEQLADSRRRQRDTLQRASRALATPGD
jgi:hypothetical protein